MEINKIYNTDIFEGFKLIDDNSINVIITSPPYNVGIKYDSWTDKIPFKDYFEWCKNWLIECRRVLKDDGRIAINIPFEISNNHDKNWDLRVFIAAEFHAILKEVCLHGAGVVRLVENYPHIVNKTAWGSWLSVSAPYIYNPEECALLAYKNQWKRLNNGLSTMTKQEFIQNVTSRWLYRAETKGLTQANFSLDFPLIAIKMLSYQNDIILDPFMGSGTTGLACLMTKRNYLGFEISKQYHKIAEVRIQNYIDRHNNALKDLIEY